MEGDRVNLTLYQSNRRINDDLTQSVQFSDTVSQRFRE
jgi:hypothetical protein